MKLSLKGFNDLKNKNTEENMRRAEIKLSISYLLIKWNVLEREFE